MSQTPSAVSPSSVAPSAHQDLLRHLAGNLGVSEATAARVVGDVLAYFDEPIEHYVRRRHTELQDRGRSNAEIWPILDAEVAAHRFPVEVNERRLRRLVYG